jgi:hypothetical protein
MFNVEQGDIVRLLARSGIRARVICVNAINAPRYRVLTCER